MKRIVDFFRKDVLRKLIAFAIALFIFYNFSEKKELELRGVNVKIRNDDPEVFIDPAGLPATVRLTVKGSKHRIDTLEIKDFSGEAHLSDSAEALRTGWANLRLSEDNFTRPLDIEITNIEPRILQLQVHRQVRRDLPITPKITGKPGKGKTYTALRCNPKSVTVIGPEKQLAALTSIGTEELSIEGETIDFNKKLKLENPSKYLTLSSPVVDVTVEIRDATERPRQFSRSVLYMVGPSQRNQLALETENATVHITGAKDELDQIKPEQITVCAAVQDLTVPGEYFVPLTAFPEKIGNTVKVTKIEPAQVKVVVRSAPEKKQDQH